MLVKLFEVKLRPDKSNRSPNLTILLAITPKRVHLLCKDNGVFEEHYNQKRPKFGLWLR